MPFSRVDPGDVLSSPAPIPIANWDINDLSGLTNLDQITSWIDRQNSIELTPLGATGPTYFANARDGFPAASFLDGLHGLTTNNALLNRPNGVVIIGAVANRGIVGTGTETLCSFGTTVGSYARIRMPNNAISWQDAGGMSVLTSLTNLVSPYVFSARYESANVGLGGNEPNIQRYYEQLADLTVSTGTPVASNQFSIGRKFESAAQPWHGELHSLMVFDAQEIQVWEQAAVEALVREEFQIFPTDIPPTIGPGGGGTFPLESQVISPVVFGPTDNLTGDYVTVAASSVRSATTFGSQSSETGTAAIPTADETLLGVSVDATVGNVTLPPVGNVTLLEAFGPSLSLQGTVRVPFEADVRLSTAYGPSDQLVGTLIPASSATFPTEAQVLLGVVYGTIDELTGNVVLPPTSSVWDGDSGYGSLGSTIGIRQDPSADDLTTRGTFGPSGGTSGNFVFNVVGDVRLATQFGTNGTEFVGTLDPGAGGTVPAADDVRDGVAVGAGTGNLVVPIESTVIAPTTYDSPGVQKTGTYVTVAAANIRLDTPFGAGADVGNVRVPPVGNVLLDYQYDTLDSLTGTLDPGAGGTVPAASDVRLGVAVGNTTGLVNVPSADFVIVNIAIDQGVGNYTQVTEPQVLEGIEWGANGNQFTGSLVPSGGETCEGYPLATQVADQVVFGQFLELVGNRTDCPQENALLDTLYGGGGNEFTGSLVCAQPSADSSGQDIRFQITQDDDYLAVDGRELTLENQPASDLTDATTWLEIVGEKYVGNQTTGGTGGQYPQLIRVEGTIDNNLPVFELTSTDTAVASGTYRFSVVVTLNTGSTVTIDRGWCQIALAYAEPD